MPLLYGLPVYAASVSDLNAVQSFLTRCYKRRYTSAGYEFSAFREIKFERRLFNRFKHSDHPLYSVLPRYKESSLHLSNSTSVRPHINTERFKSSFFNILIFKNNILYMIFRLLKTLIFLFIAASDMYFYLMNKDPLLLFDYFCRE